MGGSGRPPIPPWWLGTPRQSRGAPRYSQTHLSELLVHELVDALERPVRRRRAGLAHDEALALALEQLEVEVAAGLAIGRHEPIEVRPRMCLVLGALQIERRRHLDLLALLEGRRWRAFVHGRLGPPVRVVERHDLVGELRIRRTAGLE